ncbi:hypothetical protein J8J27_25550, partial [Mycobacterium tuberculosis]|nr:hypothetical protein [Mycobacterium tuberculosis]
MRLFIATAFVVALVPLSALAADDIMTYPEACRAKGAMPMGGVGGAGGGGAGGMGGMGGGMGNMGGMAGHGMAQKDHQQAAMAGMTAMNR